MHQLENKCLFIGLRAAEFGHLEIIVFVVVSTVTSLQLHSHTSNNLRCIVCSETFIVTPLYDRKIWAIIES